MRLARSGGNERHDGIHPCETKVVELSDSLSGDENVGRLDIAVDDDRFVGVEVLETARDAEHDLKHREEGRVRDRTKVVEEVAVGAQLGDDHDGDGRGLLGNGDADEVNDVGVAKVAKEAELFDVHVREVSSNVGDGDRLLPVYPFVDILRERR